MAGELQLKDWTGDNVGLTNFQPYTCVDIDVSNSGTIVTAVGLSASGGECIGVCYDQSKLNPDNTVRAKSGIAIRSWGIARVVAASAITAGDYVAVSGTAGKVATKAQAAAGAQPGAIVGRALTSAGANNDRILVLLMIGARY